MSTRIRPVPRFPLPGICDLLSRLPASALERQMSNVLEETIYRLAPCAPLAIVLGPWRAIAVSGLVFGALHVVAGNPSPENVVGGFLLAWVYVKSGSIAVPVLLHRSWMGWTTTSRQTGVGFIDRRSFPTSVVRTDAR